MMPDISPAMDDAMVMTLTCLCNCKVTMSYKGYMMPDIYPGNGPCHGHDPNICLCNCKVTPLSCMIYGIHDARHLSRHGRCHGHDPNMFALLQGDPVILYE